MQRYMYQAGYTPESIASLIEDPQDRIETVRKAFKDMGAEIVLSAYPIGEYDVLIVYDAPDDATAAALTLAIAAGGATRSAKTTRLLNGEEWTESLRMAQRSSYQPMHHRMLKGYSRWPLRRRLR